MFPIVSIHCYQLPHLLYPTCPLEVILWRNHYSLRKHLTNMKSAMDIFFIISFWSRLLFFTIIQRWSYMKARDCILLWFFSVEMWTCTLSYSEKGRFRNAWIQVEFSLNSPDFRWKYFLYDINLLCERKKIFTLTLFRMGLFETAHG